MVNQLSSVKEVIGNIIRNTRVEDTSYILDMPEWIGEAMAFMRSNQELVTRFKEIEFDYHVAKLPSGLVSVECVEYNGYRMKLVEGQMRRKPRREMSVPTIFQTVIVADTVSVPNEVVIYPTVGDVQIYLTEWTNLPYSKETYYIEDNYIKSTLQDGMVRIMYKSIPTDLEGFPLVPDNANFKQAIYWHCRAMMIGAGYEDKVFNYEYCDAQYEKYAGRAIGQIRFHSPEQREKSIPSITRYLPDNYLSYFHIHP